MKDVKPPFLIRIDFDERPTQDFASSNVVVGRAEDADFQIIHDQVSRNHLDIEAKGQAIWLTDLGSSNGTFVNGLRIEPNRPMLCPDVLLVRLGTKIELRIALVPSTSQVLADIDENTLEKTHAIARPRRSGSLPPPPQKKSRKPPTQIAVQEVEASLSVEETNNPLEPTQSEQIRPDLNDQIRLLQVEVELLRKESAEEMLKYGRLTQESKIDAARAQLEIESRKRELDIQRASMQVELQELKSKKDLAVQELTVIERTREHTASEVENLRKRWDDLVNSNQKAQVKMDSLQKEIRAMSNTYEDARTENTALNRLVQSTEKELITRNSIANDTIGELKKLREEKEDLERKLEREKERLMREASQEANKLRDKTAQELSEARDRALNDAKKIREEAREEAEAAQKSGLEEVEKARLKAARESEQANRRMQEEIEQLRTKARREIEELRARLEEENKKLREEAASIGTSTKNQTQEELEKQRRLLEEQKKKAQRELDAFHKEEEEKLAEKKRQVEHDIGERMALERRENDLRKEEDEAEREASRSNQIREIATNLEQSLGSQLDQILRSHGASKEEAESLLKGIRRIVEGSFLPSQSQSQTTDERLFHLDPQSAKHAKHYWVKVLISMVGAILIGGVWLDYSSQIKQYVAGLFPRTSPSEEFIHNSARELAAQAKFEPPMDEIYKGNYADNVVYTTGYLDMKLNDETKKRWVLELNHFFLSELHFDEKVIVKYVAAESTLIRKLSEMRGFINPKFERDSVARLHNEEAEFLPDFMTILGGETNYQRVRTFEKSFYEKYRKSPAPASITATPKDTATRNGKVIPN